MHRIEWIEPHTHLLIPSGDSQNFVLVERDFSDLESKVEHLLKHPEDAQRIAEHGAAMFRDRYLTPAAQACYWRRLFNAWRGVMGFEAELWVEEDDVPNVEPPAPASPAPPKEEKEDGGLETIDVRSVGTKGKKMRGKPFETFILEGYRPVH